MNRTILGDKAFYRSIFAIGLPVAFQNLLATTASMVDTIMLGAQGELAVAAVGICSQFSSLMFSAYFGFTNGGMLFFAQYWGAKDEEGICRAYGVTQVFMMLVALLFAGVSVLAPEFVLSVYTDKPNIQAIGVEYLRITGWSYPLQVLAMAISSLLRSTEKVKQPLYASIVSLLTNCLVNYLLIFGKFGLPAMGARGAAVGTVVSAIVNVGLLYLLAARDDHSFVLRMADQFRWTAAFVRQYLAKSLPIIGNELLYGVGQMLINIVIGRQDEAGIAAMAAFRVVEGLIFAFFVGLSSASGVVVGKQIGAGQHESGFLDAKRFALICPTITLCICLLLLPVRGPLLGLFGLGETALYYGKWMLLVYAVAGTVRTCNYMMNNNFRAGGEPVFGTVLEISGLFLITVPLTWCAGIVWRLPFLAVFSFMYMDEFLRLFLELWYLRSGRWIKPVTVEGAATLEAFRASLALRRHSKRRPQQNA